MLRGLSMHVALLALAVLAELYVWTRDKKTAEAAVADVTVWSGAADDVQKLGFEGKGKTVTLEAKSDAAGRWFLGKAVTTSAPKADAGPPTVPQTAPKTVTFVSVAAAQKVAEALAPFRALRDLGKIAGAQDADFGFKEPEGTVSVTISGTEHKLLVGGSTPGGNDRYLRDEGTGEGYAAKGDFVRDLESGDGSLTERDAHGYKDEDLKEVRIVARGKSRVVLRRGPEGKRIWADGSDPEKADETATNWLAKIDRLRPTEYLPEVGGVPEPVVRLEYAVKGASGIFFELAKLPASPAPEATDAGAPSAKHEYVARSERTRLWTKVPSGVAEQVEQDLGSVLK